MEVCDTITYKNQKIVAFITDKDKAKFFYDKDYGILLGFLRSGPKTIKEIEEAYQLAGNEKSDKTIYRYIKELSEEGLVVEAGKRIYTDDENKNRTLTIYMRTAKVYWDKTQEFKKEDMKSSKMLKIYKAYKILLDELDEDKTIKIKCIEDIFSLVYQKGERQAFELLEKADDKVFDLLEDLDYFDINEFVLNLAWLVLTLNLDFKKKIENY